MSMSTAYHLLRKATEAKVLTKEEAYTIIGVVKKSERQRIIKLLQSEFEKRFFGGDILKITTEEHLQIQQIALDIDLIRGEKK